MADPIKASDLKDISDKLKENKVSAEQAAEAINDLNDSYRKYGKTAKGAIAGAQDGVEDLVDTFKSLGKSPGEFISRMKRLKESGAHLQEIGGALKGMPGLMGKVGSAAKTLGGTLGGISKILGGWPGLILFAVTQIVKGMIKLDSYVKDLNKRFVAIRGPDIMTDDVKKQMKDFNDSIFDIGANIRDNLQPEAVYSFLEAVSMAGMRITSLNTAVTSYRDAVHVAAKASMTLSLSMDSVGKMMSDMMTNYQMDLNDVDGAMAQVGFDAGKTGLSTERFWGAVENTSAALSFYGTFIKAASKAVEAFVDAQVAGADQTMQTTTDMYQVFNKNTVQANMAIVDFAHRAGQNFQKSFQDAAGEIGKQAADIEQQIQVTEGPEREKLLKKLAGLQAKQNMMQQAAKKANSRSTDATLAMAQMLPGLMDDTTGILAKTLSGATGMHTMLEGTLGNNLEILTKAGATIGMTKDQILLLVQSTKAMDDRMKNLVGIGEEGIKADGTLTNALSTASDEALAKYDKWIKDAAEPDADLESLAKDMSDNLNIGKEQARQLLEMSKNSDKTRTYMLSLVKLDKNTGKKSLNYQAASEKTFASNVEATGAVDEAVAADTKNREMTDKQIAAQQDKAFGKIIKNTRSLDDIIQITKKGTEYYSAAMLNSIVGIAGNVADMAGEMFKDHPTQRVLKAIKDSDAKRKGEVDGQGKLNDIGYANMLDAINELQDTTAKLNVGRKALASLSELRDIGGIKDQKLQQKKLEGFLSGMPAESADAVGKAIGKMPSATMAFAGYKTAASEAATSAAQAAADKGDFAAAEEAVDTQDMLDGITSIDDAMARLKQAIKDQTDPNKSKEAKKTIKILSNILSKSVTGNNDLYTMADKEHKSVQEEVGKLSDQQIEQKVHTEQLKTISGNSDTQVELEALALTTTDKGQEALGNLIAEKMGTDKPERSLGEIFKTLPLFKLATASLVGSRGAETQKGTGENSEEQLASTKVSMEKLTGKKVEAKQGLQDREVVTKKGLVQLHSGEKIEGADFAKEKGGKGMGSVGENLDELSAMYVSALADVGKEGLQVFSFLSGIDTKKIQKNLEEVGEDSKELAGKYKAAIPIVSTLVETGLTGGAGKGVKGLSMLAKGVGKMGAKKGTTALAEGGTKKIFSKEMAKHVGKKVGEFAKDELPKEVTKKGGEMYAEAPPTAPTIPYFDATKKAPIMKEPGALAAGGRKTEKNITINVSANEKDLSQRIANDVRGVLYRNQVDNLG